MLIKKKHDNIKIGISIMAPFVVLILQFMVLYAFDLVDTSIGMKVKLLAKGIVTMFFLFSLPIVIRRKKLFLVSAFWISIMIFLYNVLMFDKNIGFLKSIILYFLALCLPCFIYSFCIENLDNFSNIARKASLLIYFTGIIIVFLMYRKIIVIDTYNQSISYYLLLPVIIYTRELFNKFSFKALTIVFSSLLVMISIGSRGALMVVAVYIVLNDYIQSSENTHSMSN